MQKEYRIYTFILAHYNQYKYIFTAIDSVLKQDFPKIEIIVVDDGSETFNREEVLEYINTNKKQNIVSAEVLVNEENIGTVRSMNRALEIANGEYIQIFASDDKVHDEGVASSFVRELEELGEETQMIVAHAMVMDNDMTPPGRYFLEARSHEKYNSMSADEQFKKLAFACDFAMGAICAKAELYKRMGNFNECFKYIEDWPFFLHITREGTKIHTVSFAALDHRDGGISKTDWFDEAPPVIKGFIDDLLRVMEIEILPYLKDFSMRHQDMLIEKYYEVYRSLLKIGGTRKYMHWYNFWKYSKKIVVTRFFTKWRFRNGTVMKYTLLVLVLSLLLFFASSAVVGKDLILSADFFSGFSGIILISSSVFLLINVIFWVIWHIHRFVKERK